MECGEPKFELASPEWFAAIADALQGVAHGLELDGRTYTISEEFTDPPAHLRPPDGGSIAWHFTVCEEGVEIGDGPLADADLVTIIDYETCVPGAKAVYGEDVVALREARQRLQELTASGKMVRSGDERALPRDLRKRLMAVHDRMAIRTL